MNCSVALSTTTGLDILCGVCLRILSRYTSISSVPTHMPYSSVSASLHCAACVSSSSQVEVHRGIVTLTVCQWSGCPPMATCVLSSLPTLGWYCGLILIMYSLLSCSCVGRLSVSTVMVARGFHCLATVCHSLMSSVACAVMAVCPCQIVWPCVVMVTWSPCWVFLAWAYSFTYVPGRTPLGTFRPMPGTSLVDLASAFPWFFFHTLPGLWVPPALVHGLQLLSAILLCP